MPRFPWLNRNIVGFGLTSFFNDFSHEMTLAVLPMFIQAMVGATRAPIMLGLVIGVANAVSSITKLLTGWVSDKVGHYKIFLVVGYTITPLFVGLIGTAHYIWQVAVYKTISLLGKGIREPARDAWLSKTFTNHSLGKAFGFQRALDTLGAIAGPLVAFFAIRYVEFSSVFFIALIPGLIGVTILILLTKEEPGKGEKFFKEHFFESFRSLPAPFLYFVATRTLFGFGHFNRTLIVLRAQQLFTTETSSTIIASGWAILLYILFNIIRAVSEMSVGYISDTLNRKFVLALLGFGLFGASCLLMVFVTTNVIAWILIFIMAGMSTGTVAVVSRVYSGDLLPTTMRGTGYGLLQTVDGLGILISSVMVGQLWTYYSASLGFAVAAIISFVSMLLLLMHKQH